MPPNESTDLPDARTSDGAGALLSAAAPQIKPTLPYGAVWRRGCALGIDLAILLPAWDLSTLAWKSRSDDGLELLFNGAWYGFLAVSAWMYFSLLETSPWQATVGKKVLRLKATTLTGERIRLGRATVRFLCRAASLLTLNIGFVMAVFTSRRQALHDVIARTLVVSEKASQSDIARAPRAARGLAAAAGLVLVALSSSPFVIVGLLTYLAEIASPGFILGAYQLVDDYVLAPYRDKRDVARAYRRTTVYEKAIASMIGRGESLEMLNTDNLPPDLRKRSQKDSIAVLDGLIIVHFKERKDSDISDTRLVLMPGRRAGGGLIWICGRADLPKNVTLLTQNEDNYTTVPVDYLPEECGGEP